MAAIAKIVRSSKSIYNISKLFSNLSVSSTSPSSNLLRENFNQLSAAGVHTSARRNGLMEFFDDEKNWGVDKIKVGRSWRKDELRLKSNEDLHKLWFVLLKEKNMLLTMEYIHDTEQKYFPNPERIDKVEESMENLEEVVRERNKAYYELETGVDGERPTKLVYNQLGLKFRYKLCQHITPKFMNSTWHKNHTFGFRGRAVSKFRRLLNEKIHIFKLREKRRRESKVRTLLRLYPNMDIKALEAQYPEVDIERVKTFSRSRGHFLPE